LAAFGASQQAFVQVVRDITRRHHLELEREHLLLDLGERVKALRCMHAIAELIERPGISIPSLLGGVVDVLPAAFRHSEQLLVRIDSQWGWFGANQPDSQPNCYLERVLWVEGQSVGRLMLWYATESPDSFLPSEHSLVENAVLHTSETIERLQSTEKIRRLSYMYEMLSATNRAVIRCRTPEALLDALFDALTGHGAFPILYMALTDAGGPPLFCYRAQGVPAELMPELEQILRDPSSFQKNSIQACAEGKVVYIETAQLSPQKSEAWMAFLQREGILGRALMPLVCGDTLIGVVGILSRELGFDDSQLNLIRDMASDIRYGLDGMASEQRRLKAEQQVSRSEHRFQEVFNASPVPMQIVALDTLRLRSANRAFEQWLGYASSEQVSAEEWFSLLFEDPMLRQRLWIRWAHYIEAARLGETISSPELTLRCQDGSHRIAQCSLTIVHDDLIVAWTDLTEIRHSERILRESEQRFRGMIEQTVSGIFVCRDNRFIYVNPKFCEMVGWSATELLEQDLHLFVTSEKDEDERTASNCSACTPPPSAKEQVNCVVPLRCKDGRLIELDLRSSRIIWDDGLPASIVLAQDITERQLAEAQIAHYIEQLEGAMKGTLQAVSNMVEMRDPYTAGHERRVGLIARAIGAEMGWSEARCETLEMAGLVHDIGKIAIPAEILSKPSRLSHLEMELVRGHAQASYDILKDISFAAPVADIIHQHHERMNGTGYPRQLRGEQILPEARVLAVADVIESMAAHRPYRPALGVNAALEEVERGKGTLYDVNVVEAAQRLIRDKAYQLPA